MECTPTRLVLFVATLLHAAPLHAETVIEGPLASLEARVGYGASLGGQAETSVARYSPLSFKIRGSWLVNETPRFSIYGSLASELGDRNAAGVGAGAALPVGKFARMSGGAVAMLLPYRLIGPTFAIGGCYPLAGARPCLDLEATWFTFGGDLPKKTVATQIQAVLGLRFDVL